MFGFQRIGDLIWAAGDMRCRGFLLGGTAGRTTLVRRGPCNTRTATAISTPWPSPPCMAYDPCYAYELSVIVLDGIRKMYFEDQDIFYYITLMNENYAYAPSAARLDGRHLPRHLPPLAAARWAKNRRTCGSSAAGRSSARRCARRTFLEQKFGVSSSVYSVTSYKNLYYDGRECDRWNRLHPDSSPRRPYVAQVLADSPQARSWPLPITWPRCRWRLLPGSGRTTHVLGTDGFGRSEAREDLRRFFEVDAENIALAALEQLARSGELPKAQLSDAVAALGLDPEKLNQVRM